MRDFHIGMMVRVETRDGLPRRREPDSLEQLIERKHTELRLDPSMKDPKLMKAVTADMAPGVLFGIDRAGVGKRLAAQHPGLMDMWKREVDAQMALYRGHLDQLAAQHGGVPLDGAKDFPDLGAHLDRIENDAAFLREKNADAYEERRAPFYANLTCAPPGFNMKLSLDDVDPPKAPKVRNGEYDHSIDAYIFDLPDGSVKINGKVIAATSSGLKPREAVVESMRIMADEVRTLTKRRGFTAPSAPAKPKVRGGRAAHAAVCVDRLGFEKVFPQSDFGHRMIVPVLYTPSQRASAGDPCLKYEQVEFEMYRDTERMIDGEIRPCIEYREIVRPAQGRSESYESGKLARALFDTDPRIVELVKKVGDAKPCGRSGNYEAMVVNLAAETIRLKPFFDKAWERGADVYAKQATVEQKVRYECESRARTIALACRPA